MKLRWRFSIIPRVLLLLLGLVALQMLQLAVGIYSMRGIEQQGTLAASIHAQGLQTLQLGDQARELLGATSDRTSREAGDRLALALAAYGQDLLRLERLFKQRYRADDELQDLAQETLAAWDQTLQPLLRRVNTEESAAARAALAGYASLSATQAGRFDRMLRILARRERDVARRLVWVQTVVVGLSLLLVFAGAYMLRRVITLPLREFLAVTRAIADGAHDRRVQLHAADEMGELARTFNRMAAAIEDKTDRLRAMNEVALVVTSSLSLKDVLDQIMRYGMPLAGARGVCIAFYDEGTRTLRDRVTRGLSATYVATFTDETGHIAEEVIRRDEAVVSHDGPDSEFPLTPAARAEGIHSIACLPLQGKRAPLGVIYFYRGEGERFGFEDIELIGSFSRLAAHSIQNARLHERTVDLAETDALTGLYNRRKLEQRLREEIQRAQRSKHPFALLLLDIDHFKRINDRHGHSAGDVVLKALAHTFERARRDIDLVARSGGEEYMFVLPETDEEGARRAAERVRVAIAETLVTLEDGTRLQVTASIGVACYPNDATRQEDLIARVDRAMYAAKQQGRDRVVVYSALESN